MSKPSSATPSLDCPMRVTCNSCNDVARLLVRFRSDSQGLVSDGATLYSTVGGRNVETNFAVRKNSDSEYVVASRCAACDMGSVHSINVTASKNS